MNQPPNDIVVIGDHEVIRSGLRSLLSLELEKLGVRQKRYPWLNVPSTYVLLDVKLPYASGTHASGSLLAVDSQLHISY